MISKKKWLAFALAFSMAVQPVTYVNAAAQQKEQPAATSETEQNIPEELTQEIPENTDASVQKAAEKVAEQAEKTVSLDPAEKEKLEDFMNENNISDQNVTDGTSGFTVNEAGHITAVDFSDKQYKGTLNLDGFSELVTVKIGSGLDNLKISNCLKLTEVDLSKAKVTSTEIRDVDWNKIKYPTEGEIKVYEDLLGDKDDDSEEYVIGATLDIKKYGIQEMNPLIYVDSVKVEPKDGIFDLKDYAGKKAKLVFKPQENVTVESNEAVIQKAEAEDGWELADGKWRYKDSDDQYFQNGILTIGDAQYYFENGYLKTGMFSVGEKTYYASVTGDKPGTASDYGKLTLDDWALVDGYWYFFNEEGVMEKDRLLEREDGTYLLAEDGKMLTGKQQIDNAYYFFNSSGRMVKNNWGYVNGTYYWLGSDGKMLLNQWLNLNGIYYFLQSDGTMAASEWLVIGGHYYHFNKWGDMSVGWYRENGIYYYLDKWGAMVTGWRYIDGYFYYFKYWGGMATGWVKDDGVYYYLGKWGDMKTGWVKDGNYWYYMNKWGAMTTGWQQVNGKWYYMNQWGAMVTGWLNIGNDRFYLKSDGTRVANQWYTIGGKKYYFDERGRLVRNGWTYINGYKFYLDANGSVKQDVTSLIGKQSSYYLTVDRSSCVVMVYAWDSQKNGWYIPVKAMTCSVGLSATPTPVGTFQTSAKYRWHTLMGPSYGQYCTRIVGGILFHSVAGNKMSSHNLFYGDFNLLGQPASHGCVRLCVRDAKWVYDNCPSGTTVRIGDRLYQPFDKPVLPKMTPNMDYDPTDPNV